MTDTMFLSSSSGIISQRIYEVVDETIFFFFFFSLNLYFFEQYTLNKNIK